MFLWAFDLIELKGDDLRRVPLAVRKTTLADVLARAAPGPRLNEHLYEEHGPLVLHHDLQARARGSDSPFNSGRSPDWIKSKNPNAPAVKREAAKTPSVKAEGLVPAPCSTNSAADCSALFVGFTATMAGSDFNGYGRRIIN